MIYTDYNIIFTERPLTLDFIKQYCTLISTDALDSLICTICHANPQFQIIYLQLESKLMCPAIGFTGCGNSVNESIVVIFQIPYM